MSKGVGIAKCFFNSVAGTSRLVKKYEQRVLTDGGSVLKGGDNLYTYLKNLLNEYKKNGLFYNSSLLMIPSARKIK